VKSLERPVLLALVYAFCSVLFGPAIYLGGYLIFTQGLMDYCDSTASAAEFDAAQGFQIAGAGTMLGGGCVLLIDLWAHRRRISRIRFVLSSFGILVMMIGFVFLILVSGPSGQVCSPG
jgi:hypothetical protein